MSDTQSAIAVVLEQAEDDGLWFVPQTITEDYLQLALRRLHAAVEAEVKLKPIQDIWYNTGATRIIRTE